MQSNIEDGFVEPNITVSVDFKEEYDITQVNYFSDNPEEFQQLMDLQQSPIETSKALEKLKNLRKATMQIYSNLFYFKQFLDDKQIDEKAQDRQYLIVSLPQQSDQDENIHTRDYQKVLYCKYKTLKEIISKSHVDLKNLQEKLRRDEENIRIQVQEMKQCASFSTHQQLKLFSRAYPLQSWFPFYVNLYCDQLASKTLSSEDLYIPFSIEDNKILTKVLDENLFTVIIRTNNNEVFYSSPLVDSHKISELEQVRNKQIENVLLVQFLREKLDIPIGQLKVDLPKQCQVEFDLLPPHDGIERNPIFYRKLLEIIRERKDICTFLEFVENIIRNKQKENKIIKLPDGKVKQFRL